MLRCKQPTKVMLLTTRCVNHVYIKHAICTHTADSLGKILSGYNRFSLTGGFIKYADRIAWSRHYSVKKKIAYINHESSGSPGFPDMVKLKQCQALNSLLIELPSRNDLSYAIDVCKDYGKIRKAIYFCGKHIKEQVLVEFVHEASVHKMLSNCGLKDSSNVYPVHSRCLKLFSKGSRRFKTPLNEEIEIVKEYNTEDYFSAPTISEMMVQLYNKQKMSDLSTRLRFFLCAMMQDALYGIFPQCCIYPFGSSVNGFGKNSSDLDAVLKLYPENVKRNPELFFQTSVSKDGRDLQKQSVRALARMLRTFIPGVLKMQGIADARVPIVKYTNCIVGLDCDLSINNMSAVHMSEVIYLCGGIDPRIHPLVYTLKMWAKETSITNASAGSWITNFSLILLVIHFLQNRPVPILPPLYKLVKFPDNADGHLGCVKYVYKYNGLSISDYAQHNTESLATLLKEFLKFLACFPFETKRICLMSGLTSGRTDEYPMWINYPIMESQNVAKNVSRYELENMRDLASVALRNLENNTNCALENINLLSVLGLEKKMRDSSGDINIKEIFDKSSSIDQACALPSAWS